MNYQSEALIFYPDNPKENIINLAAFFQKETLNKYIGSKSKLNNFIFFALFKFYSFK